MDKRILTHYSLFSLNEKYWQLSIEERKNRLRNFLKDMQAASDVTWFYQIYPAQAKQDIMIWSNVDAEALDAPKKFFEEFARASNKHREFIDPGLFFWGMTKPSIYSKAKRSPQEMDPYDTQRMPYFIAYPFSKTSEWYQLSREDRQEMMNDHIRIGKTFKDITQLLIYSFGLQDQEFVVSYETDDLAKFSDLVYDLRLTKARVYTLLDTPIITGILQPMDELIKLFNGK